MARQFAYNATLGRYYDAKTGRFVAFNDVARSLDRVARASKASMAKTTSALANGDITLAEWRAQMRGHIKTLHVASAASAKGGMQSMSQSDWGKVGAQVKSQYKYLEGFTRDLKSGVYGNPPDGRILVRSDMYGNAGRATFETALKSRASDLGYTQERNVLGVADHCDGCLNETARGWVDIGELVPVGERDCITNCHCRIEYRGAKGRGRVSAASYGL